SRRARSGQRRSALRARAARGTPGARHDRNTRSAAADAARAIGPEATRPGQRLMYELAPTSGPIMCVVGARPNYMKIAPLIRAIRADAAAPRAMLVHTGQHYDFDMNDRLFADLGLPAPDVSLDVGSGSQAWQTALIMQRFEPVVDEAAPSCVVVV